VLVENVQTGKRRVTLVALERFHPHVLVHVAGQCLLGAIILVTDIAGIPSTFMDLLKMCVQSGLAAKIFVTLIAGKPSTFMGDLKMGDVIGTVSKSLVTVRTAIVAFSFMDLRKMCVQSGLAAKIFVTLIAGIPSVNFIFARPHS
jgi:hypothetical protein